MTQLSTVTSDPAGLNAGDSAGGLGAARTIPPVSCSVAGPALSNSNTAASLLPAAAKAALPGRYFSVGTMLRLTATGVISNIVTTPGTFTPDVRLGNVVVFNGGAVNLNVAAKTNVSFWLDVLLTCRAVGSGTSANLIGIGALMSESVAGAAAGTALVATLPASGAAAGTGFDSTLPQTLDLFGTFSIANAGNAITVHEYALVPVT